MESCGDEGTSWVYTLPCLYLPVPLPRAAHVRLTINLDFVSEGPVGAIKRLSLLSGKNELLIVLQVITVDVFVRRHRSRDGTLKETPSAIES
jgi:hypothetical protein